MLRRQLGMTGKSFEDSSSSRVRVHCMYASPLVLLDNLGSTVIETFDPIRIDKEYRRICESGVAVCLSVASPSNMLRFGGSRNWEGSSILHISMHTVEVSINGAKSIRCALEDDNGRAFLMSAEEFCAALSPILEKVELVFINACKSEEIARAFLASPFPGIINHVVCLGSSEPVLEASSQIFSAEFYSSIFTKGVSEAFQRSKKALKSSSNPKVASQHKLFKLITSSSSFIPSNEDQSFLSLFRPSPRLANQHHQFFWLGHVPIELSIQPEDFVGRQVDIVRLCAVLFGRRVCAITGVSGMGKRTFIAEACKYMASPGGRQMNGGICLVDLVGDGEGELYFLECVSWSLKQTISGLKSWYKLLVPHYSSSAAPPRVDGQERRDETLHQSDTSSLSGLRSSYKVFWAETFADAKDLTLFLNSFRINSLDNALVNKLFKELRENGTQLQDWGSGKLVRVVHVVRLLISGGQEDEEFFLLEKNSNNHQLRLMSKKFDPVTENVLEVASGAVRKELGSCINGKDPVEISRLVLRNRKPLVEINKSSPSYPGLSTKYVLYTVDVELKGLPVGREAFQTTEDGGDKVHCWEWISSNSEILTTLLPPTDPLQRLEMHVKDSGNLVITSSTGEREKEFFQLIREWNALCDEICRKTASPNVNCALVLLGSQNFIALPAVRSILGKALVRHTGLKIILSGCSHQPVLNIATCSVSFKVIHFPLPPLQPIDAAVLFTRRIHRPLFHRDWPEQVAPPPPIDNDQRFVESDEEGEKINVSSPLIMNPRSAQGIANLARLARHPLLIATHGIPSRILAVAQHVTLDLPSINDLLNNHELTVF